MLEDLDRALSLWEGSAMTSNGNSFSRSGPDIGTERQCPLEDLILGVMPRNE